VITMALMGKIRAMRMREGKSISEIARLTSLSRNTIKKWLKVPQGAQPKYRRPKVPTKLTPFVEALTQALLSEALRDPDVLVRAMLRHSPSPDPMQKSTLAEAFLKYGRPEGALVWLQGSWAHMGTARRHLNAQALEALGRTGEAARERQKIFEASLGFRDMHAWLDLLPPHEQAAAI